MAGLLYPLPSGFKGQKPAKRERPKARPHQPKMPPIQREGIEQRALIRWSELAAARLPQLEWLYHVPNGGKRGKVEASMLKAEGVKPGIPDLHLPVKRGIYTGLRIELKATGSVPSDVSSDQRKWIKHFNEEGEFAIAVNGWELARDLIEVYLALQPGCAVPSGRYNLPKEWWIASKSTERTANAYSPPASQPARESGCGRP